MLTAWRSAGRELHFLKRSFISHSPPYPMVWFADSVAVPLLLLLLMRLRLERPVHGLAIDGGRNVPASRDLRRGIITDSDLQRLTPNRIGTCLASKEILRGPLILYFGRQRFFGCVHHEYLDCSSALLPRFLRY